MTSNPFSFSDDKARTIANTFAFEPAAVTESIGTNTNTDFKHIVKVLLRGEDSPVTATVAAMHNGDANLPQKGDFVLVGRAEGLLPVVVCTIYATDSSTGDVPSYDSGERVIGHPASNTEVRLKPNGDVYINAQGNVFLGGDDGDSFSPVARQGDAVEVSDPDSGTITGTITEGSSNVEST